GPATGVMGPEGKSGPEQVAGDVLASVRAMDVGVVPQRLLDAVAIERLAVDHPATCTLVGGDVQVHVREADDVTLLVGATEGLAARVGPGLRKRRAAAGAAGDEEARGAAAAGTSQRQITRWESVQLPAVAAQQRDGPLDPRSDRPLGGRARGLGLDQA